MVSSGVGRRDIDEPGIRRAHPWLALGQKHLETAAVCFWPCQKDWLRCPLPATLGTQPAQALATSSGLNQRLA